MVEQLENEKIFYVFGHFFVVAKLQYRIDFFMIIIV